MRHLHLISNLILLAGILVAGASVAFELGALTTLVGMMLIVAGLVKIITVRIWHGFFDSDAVVGK